MAIITIIQYSKLFMNFSETKTYFKNLMPLKVEGKHNTKRWFLGRMNIYTNIIETSSIETCYFTFSAIFIT